MERRTRPPRFYSALTFFYLTVLSGSGHFGLPGENFLRGADG
jgi:hypothetical protein